MSPDLWPTAACFVASLIKEILPKVQVGHFGFWREGFYLDLWVPKNLSRYCNDSLLPTLEEKVRERLKKVTFRSATMMRENGAQFFADRGESVQRQLALSWPDALLPVLYINEQAFICQEPHLSDASEIGAISIEKVEAVDSAIEDAALTTSSGFPSLLHFRLHGIAFKDKQKLKAFSKELKTLAKVRHQQLGPAVFYQDLTVSSGCVYLGVVALKMIERLKQYWQQSHSEERFVSSPSIVSLPFYRQKQRLKGGEVIVEGVGAEEGIFLNQLQPLHRHLYEKGEGASFAEWRTAYFERQLPFTDGLLDLSCYQIDWSSFFVSEEEIEAKLISSLQFILQTINILGLRWRIAAFYKQPKQPSQPAFKALLDKTLAALNESREGVDVYPAHFLADSLLLKRPGYDRRALALRKKTGLTIEIELVDALDRSWQGPFIHVAELSKEKGFVLERSTFGFLEKLVAILLEHHSLQKKPLPSWLIPGSFTWLVSSKEEKLVASHLQRQLQQLDLAENAAKGSAAKCSTDRCHWIDDRELALEQKIEQNQLWSSLSILVEGHLANFKLFEVSPGRKLEISFDALVAKLDNSW